MDLPTNPSALIDLLRAWFYAKDRSIVMPDNTYIIGRSYTCVKNLIEFNYIVQAGFTCIRGETIIQDGAIVTIVNGGTLILL